MNVDNRVTDYYKGRIKQVFVYITSRCQLNCRQCLYKPLLDGTSTDIDYETLSNLLLEFRKMGAYKLSFLGGEPTLYHDKRNEKTFPEIIRFSKDAGYHYVRFDTNGQFSEQVLDDILLACPDEITFSLDGFDDTSNGSVRGAGHFDRCVANIHKAVNSGVKIQITTCVHRDMCPDAKSGFENISKMIDFSESLGVETLNFHPILKVGIPRDEWIDNTNIDLSIWNEIYERIQENSAMGMYRVNLRIPKRFVGREQYSIHRDSYSYCPLKLGERALIMPDGTIKVCAFSIGTNNHICEYDIDGLYYNEIASCNEINLLRQHDDVHGTFYHCLYQTLNDEEFVPLCMSYKPNQNELVWNDLVAHV